MTETLLAPSAHRLSLASGDPRPPLAPRAAVVRPAPTVAVEAADPISRASIDTQLRRSREVYLIDRTDVRAAVTILVVETINDRTAQRVHQLHELGGLIVLIASRFEVSSVLPLLGTGVRALLGRSEVSGERLITVVRSVAAGGVDLPPPVLRQLIEHAKLPGRTMHRGAFAALTPRERQVLALVADGYSTREIATKMAYSERTIKNVLQDLTARLQLRNRTHAVAYALQQGWI